MAANKKSRNLVINNKKWKYTVRKKYNNLVVYYTSPENKTSYVYTDESEIISPKWVADHINRKIRLFCNNKTDWFSKEDYDLFKTHLLE